MSKSAPGSVPFVQEVEAWNFGPIRHGTLKLTRLHALIGPNDSGKSTWLRAVAEAANITAFQQKGSALRGNEFGVKVTFSDQSWFSERAGKIRAVGADGSELAGRLSPAAHLALGRVLRLRLDPDIMLAPTSLISDGVDLALGPRGEQLGAILDALFARDARSFHALEAELCRLFPAVDGFRLFTREGGRTVGVRLKGGVEVPPEGLSEGLLYFLAFAVQPYLSPVNVLLVEEPENGLHPSRIADVIKVLRDLSSRTQILIATHSPMVVNELDPSEVTVVTRSLGEGTRCTPLTQTRDFSERLKVYAPGELWLSYADGETEAELVATEKH